MCDVENVHLRFAVSGSSAAAPAAVELAVGAASFAQLSSGNLDFWLGVFLRLLALGGCMLAVVEVRFPWPAWALGAPAIEPIEPLPTLEEGDKALIQSEAELSRVLEVPPAKPGDAAGGTREFLVCCAMISVYMTAAIGTHRVPFFERKLSPYAR